MNKILIHGSGHKATSWNETISYMEGKNDILCPNLSSILNGKKDSANIKSAYFLFENIKNAKLEIIENTGHIVNEESPKILAKILDEYYDIKK